MIKKVTLYFNRPEVITLSVSFGGYPAEANIFIDPGLTESGIYNPYIVESYGEFADKVKADPAAVKYLLNWVKYFLIYIDYRVIIDFTDPMISSITLSPEASVIKALNNIYERIYNDRAEA